MEHKPYTLSSSVRAHFEHRGAINSAVYKNRMATSKAKASEPYSHHSFTGNYTMLSAFLLTAHLTNLKCSISILRIYDVGFLTLRGTTGLTLGKSPPPTFQSRAWVGEGDLHGGGIKRMELNEFINTTSIASIHTMPIR